MLCWGVFSDIISYMGLLEVLDDLFGIQIKIKHRKKTTKKPTKKKPKKAAKKTKKKTKKKPQKRTKKATRKKIKPKVKKKTVKKVKKRIVKRKSPKTKKKPPKKIKPKKVIAKQKREQEIGVITHYFGKISVGIIKLKSTLKVGERIHIKGANDDFIQIIKSMQLNHNEVAIAKKGDEVGIKVSKKVHENDKVYRVGG